MTETELVKQLLEWRPDEPNAIYVGDGSMGDNVSTHSVPMKEAFGYAWAHPMYPDRCVFHPKGSMLTTANVYVVRPHHLRFT
jgi:hypothetical protein